MDGAELEVAIEEAGRAIRRLSAGRTVREALQRAVSWAATRDDEPEALAGLGTGRASLGALLHAVFAVLRTSSVVDAVRVAVNQDGTSATSGHLAGQLAGLLHGTGELEPLLDRIPVDGLVGEMIADAGRVRSSSSFGFDAEDASDLWEKHPGF
jgi:ADP-ribosylglycohydrolase